MKFAQTLKKQRLAEWSRAYIGYSALKKQIKRAVKSRDDGPDAMVDSEDEDEQERQDSNEDIESHPRPRRRSSSLRSMPSTSPDIDLTMSRSSSRASTEFMTHAPATSLRQRRKPNGNSSVKTGRFRFKPQPISQLMPSLNAAERKFFTMLYAELDKVSSFYNEREAEAVNKLAILDEQLDELEQHRQVYHDSRSRASRFPIQLPKVPLPVARASSAVRTITDTSPFSRDYALPERQFRPEAYASAKKSLKVALLEEYKLLGYIKSYRLLNRTGFSKILKKFEKSAEIPCSADFMARVNQSNFVQSSKLDELSSKVEQLFAQHFTQGSRKRALQRLRFEEDTKTHHFAAARSGFFLGLSIFPLVAGLYQGIRPDPAEEMRVIRHALLQLFGALSLPVIFGMLVSTNMVVWSEARINYPLIFELDDRDQIDPRQFLELPAALFCLLSYAFWLSLSNFWPNVVPPWDWAYAWFIAALLLMLNPFPGLHVEARWWFLRRLGRVATGGLLAVEFTDFWLGDQLVSQSYFLYNLGFMICSVGVIPLLYVILNLVQWHLNFNGVPPRCDTNGTWLSPILASLPSILRAGQSLRRFRDSSWNKIHALNFGKYSMTCVFYFFYFNWRINGSRANWSFAMMLVSASVNSIYSLLWDLLLDWGLFKPRSKHRFLRNELAYKGHTWAYYVAIVADTLLRFSFILYVFNAPHLTVQLRGFCVGLLEIIRRWIWNFFRLESEHMGNADGYRITRDVPLPYSIGPSAALRAAKEADEEEQDEAESTVHPLKRFKNYMRERKTGPKRQRSWKEPGPGTQPESSTDDHGEDPDADTSSPDDRKEETADEQGKPRQGSIV